MGLDQLISHAASPLDEAGRPTLSGRIVRAAKRPVHAKSFAIAAAVLIGLTITMLAWPSGTAGVPDASVLGVEAARWSGASPDENGSIVIGTAYELEEGRAMVRTASGARVVLHGPAAFSLDNSNTMTLDRGMLAASAPTHEVGEFVVLTPRATVQDLGTDFLVRVHDDGVTDVYVKHGTVEVYESGLITTDDATRTLRSGQSLRCVDTGVIDGIDLAFLSGVIWPDHMNVSEHDRHNDEHSWLVYAGGLISDPALLLWLDADAERGVLNRALARPGGAALIVDDGGRHVGEGRHRSARSVTLRTNDHGVRAEIPGTFDQLSIAGWVKFDADALPEGYVHRGMLISEHWGEAGYIHWQAKETDFRLTFAHPDVDPHAIYSATRRDLYAGDWVFLAVVYDSSAGAVTHYWNGRVVSRQTIEGSPQPLRIGRAVIGATQATPAHPRGVPMGGLMDDLMVWSRALSDAEIKELHDRASGG